LQQLAGSPEALAALLGDLVGFEGTLEPEAGALPPAVDDASTEATLLATWREQGEAAMAAFDEWFAAGHLNRSRYKEAASNHLHRLGAQLAAGRVPDAEALSRYTQTRIAGAVKKNQPAFPGQPAFLAIEHWVEARQAIAARRE